MRRALKKNSLLNIVNNYIYDSPLPLNISYFYNWGSILGLCLVIQIITGILLAMFYVPNIEIAFNSIEYIMREVPYGWLIRYIHANGASFFFLAVYIHIVRALLYGSYVGKKKLTWNIGIILFLLMIITAFIGYTLVWGQMSLWGIKKCQKWFIKIIKNYSMNIKRKGNKRIGPHGDEVLSLIIGSLLGEGYGEKRGIGTRFVLQQEESNKEYLIWFHKYLAERGYCSSEQPKCKKRIGKNGKIRYYYKLQTFTFTSFNYLHELFYKEGKKVIPKNIGEYLTPMALAIWIQDDGGKVSAGLKIATNCFTKEEVQYLCLILKEKYNLDATLQSAGKENQYIIYIPKRSMENLSKIVKPFMLPSMYYKLNGY